MWSAVLLAAGVVFVAELGDKSQVMALAMASRHRARDVFVGIAAAVVVMFAVAAGLGSLLGTLVAGHRSMLSIVAGLVFLGFAVWALRDEDDHDDAVSSGGTTSRTVIISAFTGFAVAELGDKTQLASATLAAQHGFVPVFLGSVAGELAAIALAVALGATAGARLPERVVRYGAAALFATFGLLMVLQGLGVLGQLA